MVRHGKFLMVIILFFVSSAVIFGQDNKANSNEELRAEILTVYNHQIPSIEGNKPNATVLGVTPNDGIWTGNTNYGGPVSFRVKNSGSQLSYFGLKVYYTLGSVNGTLTLTLYAYIPVNNGGFGFQYKNSYFVTGNFTSPSTAKGTYQFINYVLTSPFGYYYLNQSGTWKASSSSSTTTYELNVKSSPDTGASITVSPNDNNGDSDGITNFKRTYNSGTEVTLTAPSTHNGKNFSKWKIGGSKKTNLGIKVTMDSNCTVTAYYGEDLPEGAPFGSFDTPIDGSTVASSIPVTGWALDENGVDNVKIYRAQGNSLVYIGDAVFVEGARPDVAAEYPVYPNNTKAGWGYMMLTNFLPNSGNGTFVIHAIATDIEGKTTTLGTKTIICDNANAVKPFGAIDTPAQGGAASGSSFDNWGWVLTPQPNTIPTGGSTINVYVDGVNIGHPTYNIYRSDIATLFPGYNNSNGAVGYFNLDTTKYSNDVHTIQWTATDGAGNTDGIGSRYFTIQNTGNEESSNMQTTVKKEVTWSLSPELISKIPYNYSGAVEVIKGYRKDVEPQKIYPNDKGAISIEIKELERLEIHFFDTETVSTAYPEKLVLNISPLPIGSTLDRKKGVFYWQPGAGFIGEYRFVFFVKRQNGEIYRKNLTVSIVPEFTCTNDTW
jgi:hypothetical protein